MKSPTTLCGYIRWDHNLISKVLRKSGLVKFTLGRGD